MVINPSTKDTTMTTHQLPALALDQLASVTGGNGFTDASKRVISRMGSDAQNGAAVGGLAGAVGGGVIGGVAGAAAGGVGAIPGAAAGAWSGGQAGIGAGTMIGGAYGLGAGLAHEAGWIK
jgi:hypothetical protein